MRFSSAYSKHSSRTWQPAQTRRAASTPSPSDGKNSEARAPRHKACSIHAYSSGVCESVTVDSTEATDSGFPGFTMSSPLPAVDKTRDSKVSANSQTLPERFSLHCRYSQRCPELYPKLEPSMDHDHGETEPESATPPPAPVAPAGSWEPETRVTSWPPLSETPPDPTPTVPEPDLETVPPAPSWAWQQGAAPTFVPPPAAGSPASAAPPLAVPRERRGARSALVGGMVGALVGALVAGGVVVAFDDDPAPSPLARVLSRPSTTPRRVLRRSSSSPATFAAFSTRRVPRSFASTSLATTESPAAPAPGSSSRATASSSPTRMSSVTPTK